jgi:hypothetical protein
MRMKLYLKLMILTGTITYNSGCTQTKYRVIHKALQIPSNCIFEKYNQEEISHLTSTEIGNQIGRKIYRSHKTCKARQDRINKLIKTHNEAHENE